MQKTTTQIPDTNKSILLPGQKILLTNTTADHLVYSAGLGTGKSWFGCRWLMHRVFENYRLTGKPSVYLYSILNYTLLNNLTLDFFKSYFDDLNMTEGVHYEINLSRYTITLWTGDKIICVSAQSYKSVVAYNIACLVCDEISTYPDDMYPYMLERLRAKTPISQTLRIGVPEPYATESEYWAEMTAPDWKTISTYTVSIGDKSWTYPRFQFRTTKGLSGKPQITLVMYGSTLENTNIKDTYIDQLWSQYGWDPDLTAIKIFGRFQNPLKDCAVEIHNESLIDCPSDDAVTEKVIGFDFNYNMTSWVVGERHDKNKVVICKNNKSSAIDTEHACQQIFSAYPPTKYGHDSPYVFVLTGDATGQRRTTNSKRTDVQILKDFMERYYNIRIAFPNTNPSVFQSLTGLRRALNPNLRTGEPIKLYFDNKGSKEVIAALKGIKFEKGKVKKGSKANQDTTHLFDCVRYVVDLMEPIVEGGNRVRALA